jgi:phosphonate metabolism-associated iron-containing alcohol dehydrogenase
VEISVDRSPRLKVIKRPLWKRRMAEVQRWRYHNPVRVECAALETAGKFVDAGHVLVVTTTGSVRRGFVEKLVEALRPIRVSVWDGVVSNPDIDSLESAIHKFRGSGIDSIVGLGGGSALDSAKVFAVMLAHSPGLSLHEMLLEHPQTETLVNSRLPLVLIPTTSGTGSEVTPFATVWDHAKRKKHSLTGTCVFPDVALLDARLTLGLSRDATLFPALDSLSHALESLWNVNATIISRAYAFQSIKLTSKSLSTILTVPGNLDHRVALQSASVLAGLAISQTKTAIAHSISYPLTSHFGMPHGLASSFTLRSLIGDNLPIIAQDKDEALILAGVVDTLDTLDLPAAIAQYASKHDIMSKISGMNTPGRLGNYLGKADIERTLDESTK